MRRLSLLVCMMMGVLLIGFSLIIGNVSGQEDEPLPATHTRTPAPTATPTLTLTPTNTLPPTPTLSPTATLSPTPTLTPSPTNTFTPTLTPTFTLTPSPTVTPIGPFFYPEGISPLTGQFYPDEAAKERRNLIVKISNYPPIVRPQTRINLADVVYEYEVEGGVTRFAAIFRNNMPTHVGSVRSARLLDLELIPMYNALLAYSGTSQPIQNLILSSEYVYQTFSPQKGDNCEDAGFCRFPKGDLAFEHTLFLDTTKLYDKATERGVNTGYRANGFAFNEQADSDGQPANDVYIDWYGATDARWQYDATSGRYLRYTDGIAHMDAGDGQQVWADNIVIIEVPHNRRPDLFPEGATYESTEIALWDQGRAYLVRDGVFYEGYWRRRDHNPGSALQIIYGNNTPIMMKPGRTWVEVVRGWGDVELSADKADMNATATTIALTATPTDDPAGDAGD